MWGSGRAVASAAILLGSTTARSQGKQIRKVGLLIGLDDDDPEARRYFEALRNGMRTLGWVDGQNVLFDVRAAADVAAVSLHAKELVALSPDVIVTNPTSATLAVQQLTRTIPVVFTGVSDPISTGLAQSFPRPAETSLASPISSLDRDGLSFFMRLLHVTADASTRPQQRRSGGVYRSSIEARGAHTQGMEFVMAPVHEPPDIDVVLEATKRSNGGLLVMPNTFTIAQRKRIVAQAARWRVPAIYPFSASAKEGGLLSYSVDMVICSGERHPMLIVFSRALLQTNCRYSSPPSSNSWSISRPQRHLA